MKKLIMIIALGFLTYMSVFAQSLGGSSGAIFYSYKGVLARNNALNNPQKGDVEGTPYIDEKFNLAEISGVEEKIMIRYDAEMDKIEFQNYERKNFILPKEEPFSTISVNFGLYKLRLLDYKNAKGENVYGYLVELSNTKDVSLLRRDKIILQEERQPKTSFETYFPPKFIKAKSEFYIEKKDKVVVSFPKNKKELEAIFPNHKEVIEAFFKNKNYSFKEEQDLIEISKFIATL